MLKSSIWFCLCYDTRWMILPFSWSQIRVCLNCSCLGYCCHANLYTPLPPPHQEFEVRIQCRAVGTNQSNALKKTRACHRFVFILCVCGEVQVRRGRMIKWYSLKLKFISNEKTSYQLKIYDCKDINMSAHTAQWHWWWKIQHFSLSRFEALTDEGKRNPCDEFNAVILMLNTGVTIFRWEMTSDQLNKLIIPDLMLILTIYCSKRSATWI